MWSETVYVKLKEEGVNSLNMMNMRFILLNMEMDCQFISIYVKFVTSQIAYFSRADYN